VKVLPERLSSSPDLRARFEREARAVSALNHPNICVLHDVGREGDADYIVMELVSGVTLGELIEKEELSLPRLLEIATQLADALGAAHEAGITHRDLKPANVMVTAHDRVKVLDFGLAKLESESIETLGTQLPTQHVTQQGSILGTAPYMSPEQAKGKPLDHRTDIFSFGTILYEMATSRRPFEGESSIELASAILRDTPPPITEVNPAMPRHLGRIVRHCLEKEPRDRFQTARDLKYELVELKKDVESGEHGIPPAASRAGDRAPHAISGAGATPRPTSGAGPARSISDGGGGPGAAAATPPTLPATSPGSSAMSTPQAPASSIGTPSRLRWLAPAFGIAVALIALVVFVLPKLRSPDSENGAAKEAASVRESASPERKMIVVLPFENLGAAEDAYFAAGMTEEFTSRLARVSGIGVISRTSAVQYDRAGKTMKQIGEDLGVDFVLEGTVRWDRREGGASRVRVTPQLIRVADDTHVWSDTYDRDIDDLFSVQSEIATNVVSSLGVTLLEPERDAIGAQPTQNLEAYQAFVRGTEYARENSIEAIRLSIKMFERAVELDSSFALAWAGLSQANSRIYHFGFDRTEERIQQARAANDRAFALAPGLPEAEISEGYYHYWIHRDFPAALAAFARAEKLLPNNSDVIEGIAFTWRRQGRFEESIAKLEEALELKPNDVFILGHIGESYLYLHRYKEAAAYVDRTLAARPDWLYPYVWKARILVQQDQLDAAHALLDRAPMDLEGGAILLALRIDLCQRNLDRARETLAKFPGDVFEDQWNYLPKDMLLGVVQTLAGDAEGGRRLLESARAHLERELATRPDDHRMHSSLGNILARLGEKEAAIREGKRGVELFPTSKDAMIGPARLVDLAGIYTITGETAAALDLLEQVAMIPTESLFALRLDPRWDALRGEPRFQRILAKQAS
jgi:TolB-like protein/Flp pilus assembly protein TadD